MLFSRQRSGNMYKKWNSHQFGYICGLFFGLCLLANEGRIWSQPAVDQYPITMTKILETKWGAEMVTDSTLFESVKSHRPESENISRAAFMGLIAQAIRHLDPAISAGQTKLKYRDIGKLSPELRHRISVFVQELGYIGDTKKWLLSPQTSMSRAEATVILTRFSQWRGNLDKGAGVAFDDLATHWVRDMASQIVGMGIVLVSPQKDGAHFFNPKQILTNKEAIDAVYKTTFLKHLKLLEPHPLFLAKGPESQVKSDAFPTAKVSFSFNLGEVEIVLLDQTGFSETAMKSSKKRKTATKKTITGSPAHVQGKVSEKTGDRSNPKMEIKMDGSGMVSPSISIVGTSNPEAVDQSKKSKPISKEKTKLDLEDSEPRTWGKTPFIKSDYFIAQSFEKKVDPRLIRRRARAAKRQKSHVETVAKPVKKTQAESTVKRPKKKVAVEPKKSIRKKLILKKKSAGLVLSDVYKVEGRYRAKISGKTVAIGDLVNGNEVVFISSSRVMVRTHSGKTVTLRME
ncbi:MAG: hypothetical protein ACI9BD_001525 [Candidatus Marinamargulisbacteria bacterium]|jgi:hypothetical protein